MVMEHPHVPVANHDNGGEFHYHANHNSKTCSKNCICCSYPSPIKLSELIPLLQDYPNTSAAITLKEGFSHGFKLGYEGKRAPRNSDNLKSVERDPPTVSQKLEKEIKLGRMAGPFTQPPFNNLIISPIGLVPKAETGKFRLIHHLSHPEGESINDGINREVCAVKYSNFDDAIELVVRAGKGANLAKADIESAFRLLPIHPDDFSLLGIKFQGQFYVDKALPMGASCSPAYFEMFSTFLEWATKRESKSNSIVHYVDDFCLIAPDRPSCQRLISCFENVCAKLGVPLASDKSEGPATRLVFLGLEIDSVQQLVSIPHSKLHKIIAKVQGALDRNSITLRELQSLIGSLSFVCKAISPGRAFLRRLIDLSCNVRKPWYKIHLSKAAKGDLQMWMIFLRNFNGCAMIPDQFWREDCDLQLFTDASGDIGFGGFFSDKWFQGRWPQAINHTTRSIAWLEFFPIVVAVALWSESLQGKRIIIRSDNAAAVSIINKQSSKCPRIMGLVRFFVLQCLKSNVAFKAHHIPGKDNTIADALSRFQMPRFREAAPHAEPCATTVPAFLWTL